MLVKAYLLSYKQFKFALDKQNHPYLHLTSFNANSNYNSINKLQLTFLYINSWACFDF